MPKKRYLVLVLGLLLMLSGVVLAAGTQSGFGSVAVSQVDFQAADGSLIHATLQRPVYATDTDPLPGVVVIHGSLQNKEWLMAFGIELSQRGFVVLTIDANGHGNSEPGSGSGTAALNYIAALDYVDDSQIGLIGHSMGGGISWRAIDDSPVTVRSLVLVGSGFWETPPYIPNTLVAVGNFDSLSSYPSNLTKLEPYFGVTDIELGVVYGDFANNTARMIIAPSTNHLFETIDPVIVSESTEWMKNSLKGGMEDEHWFASSSLTYPLWLAGGFLSLLGILLTSFPVIAILLDTPVFSMLKGGPKHYERASTGALISYGLIYGVIGAATFFPFLLVGSLLSLFIPFPQYNGIPVMSWMLGSGLLSALVLAIILRVRTTRKLQTTEEDGVIVQQQIDKEREGLGSVLGITGGLERWIGTLLRTLVLSLIAVAWLYAWTVVVDIGFALDFRVFLPGLHDLTLLQFGMTPLYFIVFLVYFLVEGGWFTSVMLTAEKDSWTKTQVYWTVKAILIKTIPYLILIAIEFGGGFLAGSAVIPGIIGYSWLFFYAFTPWFAIATVFTMFGYRVTGNRWLGAIMNALIHAWLLASILSFRG
ncbi:alpha/beta fold hydrolase [Candidatus Thorarchaeota archaeon]|nr:MAG: alpha/beta fold hydrolase [Candidatus Thorarchaeota archaeon]